MDALLRQDWIQLAAVAIGVIVTVVVFGPMFVARASAKISAQQYAARTPLATLVVGLMAGSIVLCGFCSRLSCHTSRMGTDVPNWCSAFRRPVLAVRAVPAYSGTHGSPCPPFLAAVGAFSY